MATQKTTKVCSTCKVEKSVSEFCVNRASSDGFNYQCKECIRVGSKKNRDRERLDPVRYRKRLDRVNRWQTAHRHQVSIRFLYGMTTDEYAAILDEQGGVCAICKKPETRKMKGVTCRLSVDHSHETGAVRGLLCNRCNIFIGFAGERPEVFASAVEYLARHSPRQT